MPRIRTIAFAAALIAAAPALADVKAGVDAWTRGDFAAAVAAWQAPVAAGDADAMFNLAQAYKLGRGVPQDLAHAEALYAAAAAKGHLQAADSYGLMLFQRGERTKALPYLIAASERGDPRAQYLLGIAHFNGDGVAKDWVRAYALVSLAQQGGVAAAAPALAQMDKYVPLDQRQAAVALGADLAAKASAKRAQQLASADLGTAAPPATVLPLPSAHTPPDPRTAGADYARPQVAEPVSPAAPPVMHRPIPKVEPLTRPTTTFPAAILATPRAAGPWKIQLGAFGVAANADALWAKVRARPALAGHARIDARAGPVTKLQAGGYASQADAQAACKALTGAGFTCIATK